MVKRVEFTRAFERWAEGITPEPKPSSVSMFWNPRYIVYRGAPGCVLPKRLEGLWMERSRITDLPPFNPYPEDAPTATGTPTGRYEIRGDGVWAEVFEVSW